MKPAERPERTGDESLTAASFGRRAADGLVALAVIPRGIKHHGRAEDDEMRPGLRTLSDASLSLPRWEWIRECESDLSVIEAGRSQRRRGVSYTHSADGGWQAAGLETGEGKAEKAVSIWNAITLPKARRTEDADGSGLASLCVHPPATVRTKHVNMWTDAALGSHEPEGAVLARKQKASLHATKEAQQRAFRARILAAHALRLLCSALQTYHIAAAASRGCSLLGRADCLALAGCTVVIDAVFRIMDSPAPANKRISVVLTAPRSACEDGTGPALVGCRLSGIAFSAKQQPGKRRPIARSRMAKRTVWNRPTLIPQLPHPSRMTDFNTMHGPPWLNLPITASHQPSALCFVTPWHRKCQRNITLTRPHTSPTRACLSWSTGRCSRPSQLRPPPAKLSRRTCG